MTFKTVAFDDVKVRQAFSLALDVDKWLEVTLDGRHPRAASILPPGLPGYNDNLTPVSFDPEMAKQLIVESKYESVENLPPVTAYNTSDVFISMWRDNLGVEVESVEIEEHQEFLDLLDRREVPLWDWGWCADYPDPQNFLEILFQADSKENHFAYSNPEIDSELEQAAVERDDVTRIAMYQDIERRVLGDWVAVPLLHSKSYTLIKPYVQGYFLAPMSIHVLKGVSITQK